MSARKATRGAIAAVLSTFVLFGSQTVIAQAEPSPSPTPTPTSSSTGTAAKIKDAKEKVLELEAEASLWDEKYHQAEMVLEESKTELKSIKSDIRKQEAKVADLAEQARQIALVQFRNRGVDPTVEVFTSGDPDTLLERLSTADKVDQDMTAILNQHETEQANLADLQRSETAEVTALSAQEKELAKIKQEAQDKVDQAQAMVLQLTAQQREELETGKTSWSPNELDGVTANAKALTAIKYAVAKANAGSQYVWGAEGPNGFDCSGLMLAAYRTVGIKLPHSSQAQSKLGRPVSKSELKPGDLIFWYHPIHHVGMYIGNGKIVHARNTRADLVVQTLASYPAPWAGARRIVG